MASLRLERVFRLADPERLGEHGAAVDGGILAAFEREGSGAAEHVSREGWAVLHAADRVHQGRSPAGS